MLDLWLLGGIFAVTWLLVGIGVAGVRGPLPTNTVRHESSSIAFGLVLPGFCLALFLMWLFSGGDPVEAIRKANWFERAGWTFYPAFLAWVFITTGQAWSWRVEISDPGVRVWRFGREQRFTPWSAIKSGQAYNEALVFHLEDGSSIALIYQHNWIRLVRSWCIDKSKPFYDGKQRKFTKLSD